jgi:hypothetical protein
MKTRIHIAALGLALSGAVMAAEPVTPGQSLTFAWPANLSCDVTQVMLLPNNSEQVVSRYTLKVTHDGVNLRVTFGDFAVQDVQGEGRLNRAKMIAFHDTLQRPKVEREFLVDPSGRFVAAEPVAAAEKRWAAMKRGTGALLPVPGARSQQAFDAEYAAWWRNFLGSWIGLRFVAGEKQPVMIEHEAAGSWEDANVPTEVTVSAPADCARGTQAARCVTLRSHFLPALVSKTGLDTRKSIDAELVIEPDTMVPHSWTDEERMRGSFSQDPEGSVQRRTERTFRCGS